MQNIIEIKHLSKSYGDILAVNDLSFEVKEGELFAFLGVNGAGKSTTINIMCTSLAKDIGEIIIDGYNLDNDKDKIKKTLGVVFQDFKLLPKLNVYENVSFALETLGLPNNEIRPKVLKAIEAVGLKEKTRNLPSELSGGEQQRVAIARALANDPKLLICDEPTGNLDPDTSKEIMKILDNINRTMGTTIIMATHDKELVNRMKKRVLVIEDGVLASDAKKGSYKVHESVKDSK